MDTKVSKGTKLLVTVRMGQGEISTYIKPALPHQVNIGDSIIVKRSNGTMMLVLSDVWVCNGKETKCVGLSWKYQVILSSICGKYQ